MKKTIKIFFFLLYLPVFILPKTQGESLIKNPPELTEYVTDETGTLSKAQVDYLSLKLFNFFDSTSTQVVVYMINTLDGEPIEQVAYEIAMKNKIGKKGYDNGALLLIAKDDRKLRIEVGYGLEGVLTDALSAQIIRNEITPHFKNNDYYTGISRGIDAIVSAVKGEYKLSSGKKYNEPSAVKTSLTLVFALVGSVMLIIFVFWIIAIFSSKTKYVRGSNSSSSSYRSYSGSGYSSSSSGSSYTSSSGSGFSGGGGSFGGGGASGSW